MTTYQLWESVLPQEKRWLGLIVMASLVLHVAVFFVFRIESLPEAGVIERPPSVVFISPDTSRNRMDGSDPMMWINWRDPAVIALPSAPIPEPLPLDSKPGAEYKSQPLPDLPEWNALKTPNLGVAQELKLLVNENMERSRTEAMPLNVEAPPKLSGTVVVRQGPLKDRGVVRQIKLPRPQTKVSLKASEYYVQVLAGGAVVQVKIDRSCGNSAIDQEGLSILKKWRFEPIDGEDVWARMVVFWDFQEDNPDRIEVQF
ncbi:MAG: energy transducer TonB [Verrucomicrobiota bacterium]